MVALRRVYAPSSFAGFPDGAAPCRLAVMCQAVASRPARRRRDSHLRHRSPHGRWRLSCGNPAFTLRALPSTQPPVCGAWLQVMSRQALGPFRFRGFSRPGVGTGQPRGWTLCQVALYSRTLPFSSRYNGARLAVTVASPLGQAACVRSDVSSAASQTGGQALLSCGAPGLPLQPSASG